MNYIFSFFNFLNLIFKVRFICLLVSLFIFCSAKANYLILDNGVIKCSDRVCNFNLESNSFIKLSDTDNRVLELFTKDNYGNNKLISYLFYTTDIVNVVAYSGKPLEILISLNLSGFINELRLVKHSEPILLTGIPIEKLLEAISFYKDKHVSEKLAIGEDSSGCISVPIIAGATVTSLILHETILESSRDIAIKFKLIENSISDGGLNNSFKKLSWNDLLKNKSIKHFSLDKFLSTNSQVDEEDLLVDIYFADLSHPSIGINVLGEIYYKDLFSDINDKPAILILNNGTWSFKGSGFVRGGIFDRFRIEQDGNIFTFRDSDFKNVYDLNLVDIDDYRESGIFVITNNKYKSWKPWNLMLLLNYKTFSVEYKIPDAFLIKSNKLLIQWETKSFNIFLLLGLWIFVIFIFIFRDVLSKNNFYLSITYNCVLVLDVYIIGILLSGQPSVVNLFAIKKLETFLWDPYLCTGWIMIILTIFFWGKSIFCGWICPFGALQEIIFKLRSLFFNDISLEFNFFNKLKYVRYVILLTLIFFFFYKGIAFAELLAEVEPFKTTWSVGIFNRPIYFTIYTLSLLVISFFIYRFFCRFICPLGAFLSVSSSFIFFRIKRRGACISCQKCSVKCNSKAIDSFGVINSKECFGCFTCINNMHNKKFCPPLISKKVWEKYEKGTWLNF